MKATGEIMAIERHLPAALQKAVRSLEIKTLGLELAGISAYSDKKLWEILKYPNDERFFAILELMRRGISNLDIHLTTEIQLFFLDHLSSLIELENQAKETTLNTVNQPLLKELKEYGFSDEWLALFGGRT